MKKIINYLRNIFSKETQVLVEEEQNPINRQQDMCNHKFGPAKFVKGGGREQVCKICGYVKHID